VENSILNRINGFQPYTPALIEFSAREEAIELEKLAVDDSMV
jgi:hypothetical protein